MIILTKLDGVESCQHSDRAGFRVGRGRWPERVTINGSLLIAIKGEYELDVSGTVWGGRAARIQFEFDGISYDAPERLKLNLSLETGFRYSFSSIAEHEKGVHALVIYIKPPGEPEFTLPSELTETCTVSGCVNLLLSREPGRCLPSPSGTLPPSDSYLHTLAFASGPEASGPDPIHVFRQSNYFSCSQKVSPSPSFAESSELPFSNATPTQRL
jgi:hypothetical protein